MAHIRLTRGLSMAQVKDRSGETYDSSSPFGRLVRSVGPLTISIGNETPGSQAEGSKITQWKATVEEIAARNPVIAKHRVEEALAETNSSGRPLHRSANLQKVARELREVFSTSTTPMSSAQPVI